MTTQVGPDDFANAFGHIDTNIYILGFSNELLRSNRKITEHDQQDRQIYFHSLLLVRGNSRWRGVASKVRRSASKVCPHLCGHISDIGLAHPRRMFRRTCLVCLQICIDQPSSHFIVVSKVRRMCVDLPLSSTGVSSVSLNLTDIV